MCSKTTTVTM